MKLTWQQRINGSMILLFILVAAFYYLYSTQVKWLRPHRHARAPSAVGIQATTMTPIKL